MTFVEWPGARWWKVDFHAHSPASFDFGVEHGQVAEIRPSFEEWVLAYMRAGVDAIVIADHNTHEGIEEARKAALRLRDSKHVDYRELSIFAGVEITTHGGVHLLGVFDIDTPGEVVNGLLYKSGYTSERGTSEGIANDTFDATARHIVDLGGLAIPAHVDTPAGLFVALRGNTLKAVLKDAPVIAMEVTKRGRVQNQIYRESGYQWAQILGSDAHYLDDSSCPDEVVEPKFPGSHYTWVKMETPNLEGLRLALTDAAASTIRSDETTNNPNEVLHSAITRLSVSHTYDENQTEYESYEFGPWLNAIIGGRGTGKSTVVEVSRVALDRFRELPEQLKRDFEWFTPSRDGSRESLWAKPTLIELDYHKDGHPYRIQWSSDNPAIHAVTTIDQDGTWVSSPGNLRERFPVRIYSQKQIYQIAQDNRALLSLIDAAPEVGYASWRSSHAALVDKHRVLKSKIRTTEALVSQEDELLGRKQDIQRRLDQIQEISDSGAIIALRDGEAQLAAATAMEGEFVTLESLTTDLIAKYDLALSTDPLTFSLSGTPDSRLDEAFHSRRETVIKSVHLLRQAASLLATSGQQWRASVQESQLEAALVELRSTVREQPELTNGGIGDGVSELVDEVSAIEAKLKEIHTSKTGVDKLKSEATATLKAIVESRKMLFTQRRAFINSITKGMTDLKIELFEQSATAGLEDQLRSLLRKESGFASSFAALCQRLPEPPHGDYLPKLGELKNGLLQLIQSPEGTPQNAGFVVHKKFIDHLRSLATEEIVPNIETWFPDDDIRISYRPDSSREFRPVSQGSPGQKTAALLSLILSIGNEPLILDQPEDDLDNQLIYRLVVKTLRDIKTKRQVIVITHNANIVVNGDSEYVMVLGYSGMNGKVQANGFLQKPELRNEICLIMEGGYEAFDARYRRLGTLVDH